MHFPLPPTSKPAPHMSSPVVESPTRRRPRLMPSLISSLHVDDADLVFLRDTYGISEPQPFSSVVVEFDFTPTRPDELAVISGQTIFVFHSFNDHWSLCKNEDGVTGMVPSDRLGLIDVPVRSKQPEDGRPRSPSTLPRLISVRLRPKVPRQADRSSRRSVLSLLEFLQSTRRRAGNPDRNETISNRIRRGPFSALKGGKNPRDVRTSSKLSRRVKFSSPLTRGSAVEKSKDVPDSDTHSLDGVSLLDSDPFSASPRHVRTHQKYSIEPDSRATTPDSQYSQESTQSSTLTNVLEELDSEDLTSSQSTRPDTPSSQTSREESTEDSAIIVTEKDREPISTHQKNTLTSRPLLRDSVSSRRIIYRNLLSVLFGETLPIDPLWATLQDCLTCLKSLDLVSSLVHSSEYKTRLLKVASDLNISEDPAIRKALQEDENEIAEILHLVSLSEVSRHAVLALEGDDAQKFLNAVQDVLDKGHLLSPKEGARARQLLVRLSERCDKLPTSLFINGVVRPDKEEQAVFGGGFGDIFRAFYNGQVVALKRMRIFQRHSGLSRTRRRFCREALVWQQLRNTFIVPFLGIDAETFPSYMCLVSPWMRHGTILKHIAEHGKAHLDERLHEVTQGLAYLHSQNVIHGDLRGANILINDNWQACLTDFGLTVFDGPTPTSLTSRREGSVRWMAPELLIPDSFGFDCSRPTAKTDVYAFGCVCFELYAGCPPFSQFVHDTAVMLRVVKGERPDRPTGQNGMTDEMWSMVDRCWRPSHKERPNATELVEHLGRVVQVCPLLLSKACFDQQRSFLVWFRFHFKTSRRNHLATRDEKRNPDSGCRPSS
ncbi:kinase-like protein, partial [Dendrothele bispora CBS 962.96]